MRWGATDEEVTGPYPGARLVPDGKRGPTMAITIDAPPDQVWPWLVQLGRDRGGWYSWTTSTTPVVPAGGAGLTE
jgi:proline iminopeptidase